MSVRTHSRSNPNWDQRSDPHGPPPLSDWEIHSRFDRLERHALWTGEAIKKHEKRLDQDHKRISRLEWLRNAAWTTIVFIWDNWVKISVALAALSAVMSGKVSEAAKILFGS